jgi:hypothetical protein
MTKAVGEQKEAAGVDVVKHGDQTAAAESKIKNMKKKLDNAFDRVSRAQDELDAIVSLLPIREPSYYDDLWRAKEVTRPSDAPMIGEYSCLATPAM